MLKADFNILHEKIIMPLAEKISENSSSDYIRVSNLVFEEYLKQREFFRILCKKPVKNEDDPSTLLDRHKVCAALCVTICKCKLIYKPNVVERDTVYDYHKLNEQLAVTVALSALKSYIRMNPDKSELIDSFEGDFFLFPDVSHSGEKYDDAIVRSLYMADVSNQMSLPLLAHIFFHIEKYHELAWKFKKSNE
jgi:hypothetical protein